MGSLGRSAPSQPPNRPAKSYRSWWPCLLVVRALMEGMCGPDEPSGWRWVRRFSQGAAAAEDRAPRGKRAHQVESVRMGSCRIHQLPAGPALRAGVRCSPQACTPSPSQHRRTVSRLGQRGASGTRPPEACGHQGQELVVHPPSPSCSIFAEALQGSCVAFLVEGKPSSGAPWLWRPSQL